MGVQRLLILPAQAQILADQFDLTRVRRSIKKLQSLLQRPCVVPEELPNIQAQTCRKVTERHPFPQVRQRNVHQQVISPAFSRTLERLGATTAHKKNPALALQTQSLQSVR